MGQLVKNSPAMRETWVHFLSKEDHLEKGKAAAVAAKSHQSCPTLCDPINGSPPGSPVPGILQARTLEWVAVLQQIWILNCISESCFVLVSLK